MEKLVDCIECGCVLRQWLFIVADYLLPVALEIILIGIVFDLLLSKIEARRWNKAKEILDLQLVRGIDELMLGLVPFSLWEYSIKPYRFGAYTGNTMFKWKNPNSLDNDEFLFEWIELLNTDTKSISRKLANMDSQLNQLIMTHQSHIAPNLLEKILTLQNHIQKAAIIVADDSNDDINAINSIRDIIRFSERILQEFN